MASSRGVDIYVHVPQRLETERLTLELWDAEDKDHARAVIRAFNTRTAKRMAGDLGIRSLEDLKFMSKRIALKSGCGMRWQYDDRPILYIIRHKEHDTLIGAINVSQREMAGQIVPPDLGWALHEEYFGHHFASEAAARVLLWVKEETKLDDIVCYIRDHNKASYSIATKLGFEATTRMEGMEDTGDKTEWMWRLIEPMRR